MCTVIPWKNRHKEDKPASKQAVQNVQMKMYAEIKQELDT